MLSQKMPVIILLYWRLTRRCRGSNVSTSSTAPVDAIADSSEEEEPQILKVIAAKDFGAAELVGCQVLDL